MPGAECPLVVRLILKIEIEIFLRGIAQSPLEGRLIVLSISDRKMGVGQRLLTNIYTGETSRCAEQTEAHACQQTAKQARDSTFNRIYRHMPSYHDGRLESVGEHVL